MSLRLLLLFALEQGCLSLQVFGDSLLVIDWVNEVHLCNVMLLLPILEEILLLKLHFNYLAFNHIFRERNRVADRLSKEALQLDYGIWRIHIFAPTGVYSYYHRPFHDVLNAGENIV